MNDIIIIIQLHAAIIYVYKLSTQDPNHRYLEPSKQTPAILQDINRFIVDIEYWIIFPVYMSSRLVSIIFLYFLVNYLY